MNIGEPAGRDSSGNNRWWSWSTVSSASSSSAPSRPSASRRGISVVPGCPQVFVGTPETAHNKNGESVYIEVVQQITRGESLGGSHGGFEHPWGALIRVAQRPRHALSIGHPEAQHFQIPQEVSEEQWQLHASFLAFLHAMGALRLGMPVPQTVEELQKHCGVVPVADDGFCGFWCLSHLQRATLGDSLLSVLHSLMPGREQVAPNDWNKLWEIAYWGFRRWQFVHAVGREWDRPMNGWREYEAKGNAWAFVTTYAQKFIRRCDPPLDINLSRDELAKLCAKAHRWTPILSVEWEPHGADSTWLVLAARHAGVECIDGIDDDIHAGEILRSQDYHLVAAIDAESKAVAERGAGTEGKNTDTDVRLPGGLCAGDIVTLLPNSTRLLSSSMPLDSESEGVVCGPHPERPTEKVLVHFPANATEEHGDGSPGSHKPGTERCSRLVGLRPEYLKKVVVPTDSVQRLRALRPFIIQSGNHFFILDDIEAAGMQAASKVEDSDESEDDESFRSGVDVNIDPIHRHPLQPDKVLEPNLRATWTALEREHRRAEYLSLMEKLAPLPRGTIITGHAGQLDVSEVGIEDTRDQSSQSGMSVWCRRCLQRCGILYDAREGDIASGPLLHGAS